MGYRIEVRDRNLNRIGEIDTWLRLDFTVRFSEAGYWQLLIKDGTEQAKLIDKGGGIAIYQDGVDKPLLTGQVYEFQKYWTTQQHPDTGSVYIGGSCDNQLAFDRLAFPDPFLPVPEQYKGRDTRAARGPAGRAVWWELDKALGPGALADRRVPGVELGDGPMIGDEVSDSLRYDVIGPKILEWCKTKKVGYRFVWNPNTKKIELDIYTPRDLSKDVRFSTELGNLREYIYTLSSPKVTRAIVACQGEGSERYIYQKIDSASEAEWGVIKEAFVDRRDLAIKTDKATGKPVKANADMTDQEFQEALKAVEDAADTALKEGEKNGNFQIYPIDTPQCAFGRDYFVGDIVTVIADGTEYSDIVREVNITVDNDGAVDVQPKIGEQGSGEPLNLYRSVWEMREKLRKLEARL
ncbi:siphovirus ReqiPepy6 Gp37-like family protein [Streptomyces sp. URMC 125]|uniref:siphovirus ReqiPepy6 Gp37-like family protein n=1 Tax=Streptomyces sp. URMC 125 TaxID=3423419 RepID=UPI003F1B4A3C